MAQKMKAKHKQTKQTYTVFPVLVALSSSTQFLGHMQVLSFTGMWTEKYSTEQKVESKENKEVKRIFSKCLTVHQWYKDGSREKKHLMLALEVLVLV